MKVVARTGEYTIYRKRSQRFAVRNRARQWLHGEDKVAVLLAHNLVPAPASAAPAHPEPVPADPEASTGEDGAAG